MAARTVTSTATLEQFRTTFNALSSQDFGDIGTLDAGLSATSVIGAVNEIFGIASAASGFDITDGVTTQVIGNGETLTVNGTSNEVEVAVSATDTLTIGLPNSVSIAATLTAGTSVVANTMTLSTGSITDTTGTINFGNENLTTTGTITTSGNISAGTVNSSTVPSSQTLVGRTTVDTLTNKTLTQPTITQPSISAPLITSDMTLGQNVTLSFEGSTNDGFETTLTVVNPTADRTITFPNINGTVVTTGDTGTVTGTMIANNTITSTDFNSATTLLIKNSSGTTLKTIYSPGS